jgi:hypothetical protein
MLKRCRPTSQRTEGGAVAANRAALAEFRELTGKDRDPAGSLGALLDQPLQGLQDKPAQPRPISTKGHSWC